jgi:CubicO group peptidase (beta-lactamase class C family)
MKPENAKAFQLDTVMWVASFTKLMTSICCMQCVFPPCLPPFPSRPLTITRLVERGLVSLDDSVYKHIPELESFKLITGVDSTGKPTEEKNPTPITLRHLLTHSSGLTYDYMHPSNIAWLTYHKKQPSKSPKILERFNCPLVFAPGTAWAYGPSLDYAGLLVERITGKTLEAYTQTHIWGPLGVKDATFFLSSRPDMKDRLADQTARNADGGLEYHADAMPWQDDAGNEVSDCMGGQGVFTTAEEYAKVLKAVLTNDTNEKLLKKATLEEFFKPQLSGESRAALNGFLQYDMVTPPSSPHTYSTHC